MDACGYGSPSCEGIHVTPLVLRFVDCVPGAGGSQHRGISNHSEIPKRSEDAGVDWTPETIERLKTLWADDLSGSAIAGALGTTRSSVIAKAARLGLPGRTPTTFQRSARKNKRKGHPWTTAGNATAKRVPQFPATVQSGDAPVGGVTLLDLKEYMCRWPFGDPKSDDFRFCGCLKVSGRSYCAEHLRIAFQPLRPRTDVRPFKREAA